MPPKLNDEHVGKLIEMLSAPTAPKKFSFSREINLGHMIVALTFISGAVLSYLSFHDRNIMQDVRMSDFAKSQQSMSENITQLTSNQTATDKAVTHLVWIVDELKKERK